MTRQAALQQLLSATDLNFRYAASNTIILKKKQTTSGITLGPVRVGGNAVTRDPTGPGIGYIAGVRTENAGTFGSGSASTSGSILQRGFESKQFVDGLMTNSASAGETAFIERIDVVNGPASVMYGQVNPGGMLGVSLKKLTDTPFHQVSPGFGNWGRYELTADTSDKITKSGNLRYRIAAIGVTQGHTDRSHLLSPYRRPPFCHLGYPFCHLGYRSQNIPFPARHVYVHPRQRRWSRIPAHWHHGPV
ncbi:TonB-dependent receptor plug domain-containing protein [Acetobacter oeni]|uniref:TonB-dependent receptor plug domain-containing protein n=1 Tax=Acetobacter oeni TaxID=304077 RepID=A0A511XIR0_9PROT|nr:TonB-dependent receptor plug domain-containing protein [Acetobacter oeni]MBB3881932.1 outer membrane receptor protein involved in Fe transport [Acetobacter oeni]NHO17746.1 TonB-dependent receptor plug domain-containing protein [Acetobacter oeni]GBR02387.1 hypothetical protein AA21952_0725 [Acetobacter oeni LMG 21952]GEN62824.1 hypothetical protein AOE01nite_10480 [Acetobacter oeni]